MNNFARLVRFARPYRVRFGLSIACAFVVALLFGANISAVLPLLKILFYDENCQVWLAKEIVREQTHLAATRARFEEVDAIERINDPTGPALKTHFEAIHGERARIAGEFQTLQRLYETRAWSGLGESRESHPQLDAGAKNSPQTDAKDRAPVVPQNSEQVAAALKRTLADESRDALLKKSLDAAQRDLDIADARLDEFKRYAFAFARRDNSYRFDSRRAKIESERAATEKWIARYLWARPLVDRYLPHNSFNTLVLLIALVLLGTAVKGFFTYLQEVMVSSIIQGTLFRIRNRFYKKTIALDLASFGEQGSGDLLPRFTHDLEWFGQGLAMLLTRVVREPLRAVSCLAVMLWMNWRLTLLALILVPFSAFLSNRAGRAMKRTVKKALDSMSNLFKIIQESLQGIVVVKAYTMERRERRRFFVESKALFKRSVRVARVEALSDPVLELFALSTVSIALLAGSYLVLNRTMFLDLGLFRLQLASQPMAIEDLLYLYAMLAGVSDPIRKLANVHSRIQRAAASSDRICALMDRKPAVVDKPAAIVLPRHRARVEFDNVEFSYNGRDPVLRGISLTVRHGETVALVGPNGCGKSTLMGLLPRFWDVAAGAIRIDGHDVRDVHARGLRQQIAIVLQDTTMFRDTVAGNIAYGNPLASRADIIDAAKRSFAHSFIESLPDGYDTVVQERGTSLSGGQRQRIALARAMLRDPAILILDEATSAIDLQDESLIRKAIEEFARDRTTFIITHSLGPLQFADRVVVMNAGRIEAVGTESELRKQSATFRRLHEIHFQRESA